MGKKASSKMPPASWVQQAQTTLVGAFGFEVNHLLEAERLLAEWHEELFGVNAYNGPTVDLVAADEAGCEPAEVIGRLAWRSDDRDVAAAVGGYAGVLVLSGPPAMSNPGRARDTKPSQLLAVDAFAVDRTLVDAQVRVDVATT